MDGRKDVGHRKACTEMTWRFLVHNPGVRRSSTNTYCDDPPLHWHIAAIEGRYQVHYANFVVKSCDLTDKRTLRNCCEKSSQCATRRRATTTIKAFSRQLHADRGTCANNTHYFGSGANGLFLPSPIRTALRFYMDLPSAAATIGNKKKNCLHCCKDSCPKTLLFKLSSSSERLAFATLVGTTARVLPLCIIPPG